MYLSSLFSFEGNLNSFSSTEAQVCPGWQLDGCITLVYWFFDSPCKTVVYSLAFYDNDDKSKDLSRTVFETCKKSLKLLGLKESRTVEEQKGASPGYYSRHYSLVFSLLL